METSSVTRAAGGVQETDGSWAARTGRLLDTLRELCEAHSPVGCEREVDAVVLRQLEPCATRTWQDAAGNVLAYFEGRRHDHPLQLTAHKDELGMIVKRIEPDGRLRIQNLGGMHPFKYGEGPVDVLGDGGAVVPGVLCFGSMHVSDESPIEKVKAGREAMKWSRAYIDCKLGRAELAERGVHVGSKVALGRARKRPHLLGDFVCAYALDDKGGVAVLLELARLLHEDPPPQDVYFIISSTEEIGGGAAAFAARSLPGEALIALEVAPAMPEYDVSNDARPVLLYADSKNVYDEALNARAASLAAASGIEVQRAVVSSYGSDASMARAAGAAPRIGLFAFPVENTHGYELAHLGGLANTLRLTELFVRAFVEEPDPGARRAATARRGQAIHARFRRGAG